VAWAACATPGVAPGRARARKIPAPRAAAVPASGGEAPLRRELPRLPRFVGKKELALPKGARFRRGIPCPSSGRSQDSPLWIWFPNKVSLSLSLSRARACALSLGMNHLGEVGVIHGAPSVALFLSVQATVSSHRIRRSGSRLFRTGPSLL